MWVRSVSVILNYKALDEVPLQRDPYDYLVVREAIEPGTMKELIRDYPKIDIPANYPPQKLNYGPRFADLLKELDSDRFQQLVASKFGVDLGEANKTITVRTLSERSDGNIHTDHWSKIITLLIYFNPVWEHESGRFRVLRSSTDIDDYAAEIPPLAGTLLAFRRCDHSYHGYRRFEGERRMLQMSWVRPNRFAWYAQQLARLGTHTAKRVSWLFQ